MALGSIAYFTVGYTESDGASQRKGYPLKRKYKQTENTQFPRFPSSYTQVSAQLYWLPFLSVPASDANYVEYSVGDEYGWSDDAAKRATQIPYSNPRTTKYDDYPTNHKIVFAGTIYVATRYTFEWGATKFDSSLNPYKSSNIRKWRKFTETGDAWVQYWYHPLLKRFYTIEEIDTLTELPDFDEPSQSRWDMFKGDSKDMNLNNFSFAQIKELISVGNTPTAAEAVVASIDNRAMNPAVQTSVPVPGINQAASTTITNRAKTASAGTFTVSRQSSGQAGESPVIPDNLPKMIQRLSTNTSGEKTILEEYSFNLRPNNVSYSNIGITWTEVDRVNNFPLVDYRDNKLMKISFEFVVEAHSGGKSSLYESCEDKLSKIQRIANRPELVVFTNFDSLFGEAGILNSAIGSYREWAIVDMSINSIQRTPSGENSQPGAISRATVSLTIQEVRLTKDQVIFMPKLVKTPKVPKIPGTTTEPELCIEYATDSFASSSSKLSFSPCWYKNRGLAVPG